MKSRKQSTTDRPDSVAGLPQRRLDQSTALCLSQLSQWKGHGCWQAEATFISDLALLQIMWRKPSSLTLSLNGQASTEKRSYRVQISQKPSWDLCLAVPRVVGLCPGWVAVVVRIFRNIFVSSLWLASPHKIAWTPRCF